MDISKLKVVDLKKELKTRGLSTIGTKNELMERLQEAIQEDDVSDNAALDNDDILDEEAVLAEESDEAILEGNTNLTVPEDDAILSPTTVKSKTPTIKSDASEKHEAVSSQKKIILNRKISVTSPVTGSSTTTHENNKDVDSNISDGSNSNGEKKVVKLGSLSQEERVKLRAQKFGVPIPDSLKKAVRAERFGNPQSNGASTAPSQPPDNEKLLKRQARFGIVSNEVDEKKKKRAEKFGTSTQSSGSTVIDEQKRKRAERFGLA